MADDVVEAVVLTQGLLELVALLGQVALPLLHAAQHVHALRDKVGDHLQKPGAFAEQAGVHRLRRQHADHLVLAGPDGRADEGQGGVVEAELAEEARLVGDALDGDGVAGVEDGADQPFARFVADWRLVGIAAVAPHRADHQGVAALFAQGQHA